MSQHPQSMHGCPTQHDRFGSQSQTYPEHPYTHPAYYQPPSEYAEQGPPDGQLGPEDIKEVSTSLQWIPLTPPPPYRLHAHEPLFVAIPQVAPNSFRSGPMPFMRAYAPQLSYFGVTNIQFVAFIDGLAIAQAPNPPLQAVQAVGQVIGFVPHHWAQLASGCVGLAAGVGSAAVSATRSKMYMQEANARFFESRGLKASLLSDEQLHQRFYNVIDDNHRLSPVDSRRGCVTLAERRLVALRPYIAELTFRVPPPAIPTNVLDKLSAKSVKSRTDKIREKASKESGKEEKKRRKEVEKKEKQARKAEKKRGKDKQKSHQRRASSSSSSSSDSGSSSSSGKSKEDRDDLKRVKKLKWIVIENS